MAYLGQHRLPVPILKQEGRHHTRADDVVCKSVELWTKYDINQLWDIYFLVYLNLYSMLKLEIGLLLELLAGTLPPLGLIFCPFYELWLTHTQAAIVVIRPVAMVTFQTVTVVPPLCIHTDRVTMARWYPQSTLVNICKQTKNIEHNKTIM